MSQQQDDKLASANLSIITTDFETSKLRPFQLIESGSPLFPFVAIAPSKSVVCDAALEQAPVSSTDLFQNHAAHLREDPVSFGVQLAAWASNTGWRSYSNVLGGKIMYDGYSQGCIRRLMSSPVISLRIQQLAVKKLNSMNLPPGTDRNEKLKQLETSFREQAWKISVEMVARMDSVAFLRFFGAATNNVLVRMYHNGLHLSPQELAKFMEVAHYAASKKQSLLILPCHKSHIDYLTMSWLFYRLGLSLPHIVAGANLNMPVIGSWLQKCGAFFIRRSFGDDELYPVVVKEYIEQLLEEGMNLECFIEGTRSRTGKLLTPKLGVLKYVLEALNAGRCEDVWICPISIQYDRVIETESYIDELLGRPKEKETLTGLLLNTRLLQLKMGRIDVRFQEPFSLKAYLAAEKTRRAAIPLVAPSTTSLLSANVRQPLLADGSVEDRTSAQQKVEQNVMLRALGYKILSDINKVSVVMPSALVCTVMLTIRGRGVGRSELIRRVGTLKRMIETRGGRVAEFDGMELEQVVDKSLEVLSTLIGEHKDLIEPTFYPINRFELSFYRNQIMHLFVSESLLSAALYTSVKAGGAAPSQRMSRRQVVNEVSFLSRLLQNEFVYGTDGLEVNADRTIASMEKDQVICIEEGDLIGLSNHERATGREGFDFYNFLLWPFIETYWLAAVSLFALTLVPPTDSNKPVAWYAEKEFHKSTQLLGKTLYAQGDVSYLEAVNQATLSNAFQRLIELGVILTRRSPGAKSVPLISLHPAWVPQRTTEGDIKTEGRLWEFLERLGRFRREGKNRRDNSTVSSRVFRSCSAIAPVVAEWSAANSKPEAPLSDFWASKPAL